MSTTKIHIKPEAAFHKPAVRRPLLVESAAQTCRPCLQQQTLTVPHLKDNEDSFSPVKCLQTVNSQRLTHGLNQHDVVSGALAKNDGLISCSGDSAESSRGWRWSDKSVHVPGKFSHTSLITQQRACGNTEEMQEPQMNVASARLTREQIHTPLACISLLSVNFLRIYCKCNTFAVILYPLHNTLQSQLECNNCQS